MDKVEEKWKNLPGPKRGEIVRQIGEALRKYKAALGDLLAHEVGKIKTEGDGEVQEFIDMCDLAVGMSRSIGGQVFPSERPGHFMMENYNPLGKVGVITAFNFPIAVLGWNAAVALICGNCVLVKGAPSATLCTTAIARIIGGVMAENDLAGVFTCASGGVPIGAKMAEDPRLHLISFTGSCRAGRIVSKVVHDRFGKCILELGGNNAAVIMDDADLALALKAVTFSAVGTCGQRCTTLRRTYIHNDIYDTLVAKLVQAYNSVPIGDPTDPKTLCGPLHNKTAVEIYLNGLEEIKKQGGKILAGGELYSGLPDGNYVRPTLVEISPDAEIIKTELFVPIMYVLRFETLEQAIKYNNAVPQGLASSLFTKNLQNLFRWTGPSGADTGTVNCNIGPSGAEIGGAFGGEKETGGGREAGSDAWKQYMRRSTCTINFSKELPLAQGVKFDI